MKPRHHFLVLTTIPFSNENTKENGISRQGSIGISLNHKQVNYKMKINFGILIAIAYLVFVGGMVTFAIVASNQKNDLVTENYYDEAVVYQDKIEAVKNARQGGSNLIVSYSHSEHSIRIEKTNKNKNLNGEIYFYKPDDASADFHVPFSIRSEEELLPLKRKLNYGLWKIKAQWTEDSLPCISENKIFVQ